MELMELFVLVKFPESQRFMENGDCYPSEDSSYFVPIGIYEAYHRIEQKEESKVIEIKGTQIEKLDDNLSMAGFKTGLWKGIRIYINGYGKDIKAWIEFDYPFSTDFSNPYDGCSLRVFSNTSQHKNWLIARAKKVKFKIMNDMKEAGIITEVCSRWKDVNLV